MSADRAQNPEPRPDGAPRPPPSSPPPAGRGLLLAFLLGGVALFIWRGFDASLGPEPVSYSEFRSELADGNVERVRIAGEQIRVRLAEATEVEASDEPVRDLVTYLPSFEDDSLMADLRAQDVRIETRPTPERGGGWALIVSFLPILLLVGIGFALFRAMRSQGNRMFSIGKSKAKTYDKQDVDTRFSDVAGTEGAKRDLQELVDFLKQPQHFLELGAKPPSGVLLVGPPGTGKTLLARAVAGEADVPFFSTSGSVFMEMFVGVGASRVRDLFEEAKKHAPCILFIDELDSVGRRRGAGLGGGHDEREQTLNQLLSEMDGFEGSEGVVVLAATNRPDVLDPALLRPGRFDRRVTVDLPTRTSRQEILRIHAANKPLEADVDFDRVAAGTPGFSGADLENLLNEAALLAAREGSDKIFARHIDDARDRVLLGRKREGLDLTEEDIELLACHEAGHAVVAARLEHTDPVQKVTIVPRGRAMGVTHQLPERDRYVTKKEELTDRLAVMLGGRAGEERALGTCTSGAANDFSQATQLARRMVAELGMSDAIGKVSFSDGHQEVFLGQELAQRRQYSEDTARRIDEEVARFVEQAYARATNVLDEEWAGFEAVVKALTEEEELSGERVVSLLDAHRASESRRAS